MCLIIQREPEFVIPFEKFKTAVENNKDGYGLSFPDGNGSLEVIRSPEEPDIDKLYRLINEELIDQRLMLHLRYTTAGETILRNSHPFPILEKNKDGVDLRMAHNGTLFKWKPNNSWESDTRNFVKGFVRPLFKRFIKGAGSEELLTDPFVKGLLEDQLTASSVLTFMDSEGNTLNCNSTGNGGKQEEGWYYSNSYSFNPKHRTPSTTGSNVGGVGVTNGNVAYLPLPPSPLSKDCCTVRFTAKYKINELRDLKRLDNDSISDICKRPLDAGLLIKELLAAL